MDFRGTITKSIITLATFSAIMYGCAANCQKKPAETAKQTLDDKSKKPNFITITVDDMGFSDPGVFGGEIPTPNIDKLANEGIILSQFYGGPTSTPARAMLFTGKDNHQAGVATMAEWIRPEQEGKPGYLGILSPDVPPFPKVLRDNGYYTMMTGKWDLGEEPEHDPYKLGMFDQTRAILILGGDTHYSEDDGTMITSHPPSVYKKLNRESIYTNNGQVLKKFPRKFYSTDYYTDEAIDMMQNRDKSKPFYLGIFYIAPHSPLQAPSEIVDKYMDTYSKGWDIIRKERFERQKQLGFWSKDAVLPPRRPEVKAWNNLTDIEKKTEIKRMAIYAAMVEILDNNIGRLVQYLKDIGEYENTVIFFNSDNGGTFGETGNPDKVAHMKKVFKDDKDYDSMGGAHSYVGSSEGWAMVFNAPFTSFKAETKEGGIHIPAFVHYPKSKVSGVRYNCMHSLMDIAPTMIDMAGASYPSNFNGKPNLSMDGTSMADLFKGLVFCNPDRAVGWEQDGVKGLRKGNWKLAQQWDDDKARWDDTWFLYNLTVDPFETENLVDKNPLKFQEMLGAYQKYATQNNVIPVNGRILQGLDAVANNNTKSNAVMIGGISINYKNFNIKGTAKLTDTIELYSEIWPDAKHIGQTADIFVYATYYSTPDAKPVYFKFNQKGTTAVDNVEKNLPIIMTSKALPQKISIPIYDGKLTQTGKIEIKFGYRLADGTKVSNKKPITVELTNKNSGIKKG